MEEMLIPRQTLFFFFNGKYILGVSRCLLNTGYVGDRERFVLTRGVVFDPIEELRAGSFYQFPRRGSGPAGPDLIGCGIAVRTFCNKKGRQKEKKQQLSKHKSDTLCITKQTESLRSPAR